MTVGQERAAKCSLGQKSGRDKMAGDYMKSMPERTLEGGAAFSDGEMYVGDQ